MVNSCNFLHLKAHSHAKTITLCLINFSFPKWDSGYPPFPESVDHVELKQSHKVLEQHIASYCK